MGHFLPEKLMTSITSVKSKTGSSIDVPLTYKTKGFYHSGAFRTGLSDCYKPVVTFLRLTLRNFLIKRECRDYKIFNEEKLFCKLGQEFVKESCIYALTVRSIFLKMSMKWFLTNMLL